MPSRSWMTQSSMDAESRSLMTAGRRDDLEAALAPAPGQDPEAGEEDLGLAARRRVALGPGPETV